MELSQDAINKLVEMYRWWKSKRNSFIGSGSNVAVQPGEWFGELKEDLYVAYHADCYVLRNISNAYERVKDDNGDDLIRRVWSPPYHTNVVGVIEAGSFVYVRFISGVNTVIVAGCQE